jgi:hypothetical protein
MGTRENVVVNYSVSQAQDARDAMVKRVYAELFQIVVDKINLELGSNSKATASKGSRSRFIGILDIFGFESFAVSHPIHCTDSYYPLLTLIIAHFFPGINSVAQFNSQN